MHHHIRTLSKLIVIEKSYTILERQLFAREHASWWLRDTKFGRVLAASSVIRLASSLM